MEFSQTGTHLMMTLHPVDDASALVRSADALKKELDRIVATLHLHVITSSFHQFQPYGATGFYLLSESHLSAHTFYETNKIVLDIFCCDPSFDAQNAIAVCRKHLGNTSDIHILER